MLNLPFPLIYVKKNKTQTQPDIILSSLVLNLLLLEGGRGIPPVSNATFPMDGESVLMQGKNTVDKAIHS